MSQIKQRRRHLSPISCSRTLFVILISPKECYHCFRFSNIRKPTAFVQKAVSFPPSVPKSTPTPLSNGNWDHWDTFLLRSEHGVNPCRTTFLHASTASTSNDRDGYTYGSWKRKFLFGMNATNQQMMQVFRITDLWVVPATFLLALAFPMLVYHFVTPEAGSFVSTMIAKSIIGAKRVLVDPWISFSTLPRMPFVRISFLQHRFLATHLWAPISEEIYYRGILQNGLGWALKYRRSRLSLEEHWDYTVPADGSADEQQSQLVRKRNHGSEERNYSLKILITSVLFALAHSTRWTNSLYRLACSSSGLGCEHYIREVFFDIFSLFVQVSGSFMSSLLIFGPVYESAGIIGSIGAHVMWNLNALFLTLPQLLTNVFVIRYNSS